MREDQIVQIMSLLSPLIF